MTTKRRTASLICQRPKTKQEEKGLIEIAKTPKNEQGTPITCRLCNKNGRTLVKSGEDKNGKQLYAHSDC